MTNKAGFYWHVHHNVLLEWCYDPQERIDYIKNHKPANERGTRLMWMTPVEGLLPKAVVDARGAYDKAQGAYSKARKAPYHWATYCDKTLRAYHLTLIHHRDELEALHAKEHPGCPWNGKTLVFKQGE